MIFVFCSRENSIWTVVKVYTVKIANIAARRNITSIRALIWCVTRITTTTFTANTVTTGCCWGCCSCSCHFLGQRHAHAVVETLSPIIEVKQTRQVNVVLATAGALIAPNVRIACSHRGNVRAAYLIEHGH
jgi:hypothetical protein